MKFIYINEIINPIRNTPLKLRNKLKTSGTEGLIGVIDKHLTPKFLHPLFESGPGLYLLHLGDLNLFWNHCFQTYKILQRYSKYCIRITSFKLRKEAYSQKTSLEIQVVTKYVVGWMKIVWSVTIWKRISPTNKHY